MPTVLALLALFACDPEPESATPEAAASAPAPAAPVAAPAAPSGLPAGHPPIDGSTAAATAEAPAAEPIPKAEGADGRTVAEVYAQKAELSGKPVAVRGKVVKFNPQILDTNWVHLQDGSGSAQAGDHDLTVHIGTEVQVGQVVTIRGVLATDKDFGSGYSYPVILQEGVVQP